MEEYHTAHKTICEKTINSDNILALNNMLKNMKYTDMEMELEGEFRPRIQRSHVIVLVVLQ